VLFQLGTLDQGWFPDGHYAAPTDEALGFDLRMTKAMGFNSVRKHMKVLCSIAAAAYEGIVQHMKVLCSSSGVLSSSSSSSSSSSGVLPSCHAQ
jgi:hypothetical protein